MMRKIVAVWLVMLMFVGGMTGFTSGLINMGSASCETMSSSTSQSKSYTSHAPININGNENFTSANSVTAGSGTESDSYIIENYEIDTSSATGIEIRNTDAYFIIRNCTLHDGYGNSYYGISFSNVQNGKIENCTIYNNKYGIYLESSLNNNISANQIHNNGRGIFLYSSSSNNNITGNQIYSNSYGIVLHASSLLYNSPNNNNISANQIYNNHYGIYSDSYSNNNNISANQIHDNSHEGIHLSSYSNNNQINSNQIYNNNDYGIYLYFSSNNEIHYNNIYSNTDYGVYNYNSEVKYQANAIYNWWGSADGPGADGANPVSSNVLYNPWLTSPLPSLTVTVNADPTPMTSGQTSTITVHVTDGTNPVNGATISPTTNNGGTFSPQSGTTNSNGDFTSTFTAPNVTIQSICRIIAQVTKTGYTNHFGYVDVTVNPVCQPSLTVTVNANQTTVNSSETSTIIVTVTDGTNPVTGAGITLRCDNDDNYFFLTVVENGDGTYMAIFIAPSVSEQTICRITAKASKTGYTSGLNYVNVTVTSAIIDRDGDDAPDDEDAFPDDPAASKDSDNDGYPDEWNPGKSEKDSTTGLKLDVYPNDATKWKKEEKKEKGFIPDNYVLIIVAVVAVCVIIGVVLVKHRGKTAAKTEKEKTEKPTINLRCPKCRQTFTVEIKPKPFGVKCPHCGKEGTIK